MVPGWPNVWKGCCKYGLPQEKENGKGDRAVEGRDGESRNNNKTLAGRRGGEGAGMTDEEKPKFSKELQNVSKAVEAPSHQMLSGHAMAATFLKEWWGWTDSDTCWCCIKDRQTRGRLFKECLMWKEVGAPGEEVGGISGSRNTNSRTRDEAPDRKSVV